ncbi:MAG: hypothetical protein ACI3W5_09485 [Faecousia sp.]
MTPAMAIAALDALTPNSYEVSQKLAWLERVEAGLAAEVFFETVNRPQMEEPLLAFEPYDELYIRYMQAQIFLEAGEITRYNNAMALYNNAVAALRRERIRSHVTEQPSLKHF